MLAVAQRSLLRCVVWVQSHSMCGIGKLLHMDVVDKLLLVDLCAQLLWLTSCLHLGLVEGAHRRRTMML